MTRSPRPGTQPVMVPAYVRVWSLVMKSLAVAPLSVLAETMSIVATLLPRVL